MESEWPKALIMDVQEEGSVKDHLRRRVSIVAPIVSIVVVGVVIICVGDGIDPGWEIGGEWSLGLVEMTESGAPPSLVDLCSVGNGVCHFLMIQRK